MRDVAEGVRIGQVLRVVRAVHVARPHAGLTADAPDFAAIHQFYGRRQRHDRDADRPRRTSRNASFHHPKKCIAMIALVSTNDAGISQREYFRIRRPTSRRSSERWVTWTVISSTTARKT